MKKYFLWLMLFHTLIIAQNINVVFMGIIPGGAPEFEKRFDDLLREQITVIDGIEIADYNDTEYLKKKTDFIESPVISRSFIKSLMQISNDRTLVVWGKISNYAIKPVRRWLIGAEAVGSVTISLTMYSLSFHEYAYLGEIKCRTSITKPPVFFRSVDKVTHITASDRTVIIEKLNKQAAEKSAVIINGIVRSQLVKSGILLPEKVKAKKVPSVSDLFDIPSVEAPDIGETIEKEEKKPEKEEKEPKKKEEEPKKKEEEIETETGEK